MPKVAKNGHGRIICKCKKIKITIRLDIETIVQFVHSRWHKPIQAHLGQCKPLYLKHSATAPVLDFTKIVEWPFGRRLSTRAHSQERAITDARHSRQSKPWNLHIFS